MIEIQELVVTDSVGTAVLRDVSFRMDRGERVGVVGESGSGKTTTGLALLGMIRPGLRRVAGDVRVDGESVFAMSERQLRTIRRQKFAYLGQDPAATLTPTMRVGALLRELATRSVSSDELVERLARVGLPDDPAFLRRYPHQLSGGQRQRVALARALTNDPDLLVLDEPTTGLDSVTQSLVLEELEKAFSRGTYGLLIVSHDLGVVARFADRVTVMRGGEIVDEGGCLDLLSRPQHPYTRQLVEASVASRDREGAKLSASSGPAVPVLEGVGLELSHTDGQKATTVVHGVDFAVGHAECVALVGPSGSGKTTIARSIVGLHSPDGGSVRLAGVELAGHVRGRSLEQRRLMQLVPQDPGGSLNPRRRVGATLARSLKLLRGISDPRQIRSEIEMLLDQVHLDSSFINRYPRTLSGGQRQRIAIARALAARPTVLVCDEITSALDVSVQQGVLALVDELRESLGIAVVFIAHDLGVVRQIADRVIVLDRGTICEQGSVEAVLNAPSHSLTRSLVDAASSLTEELAVRAAPGQPA